MVTPVTVQAYFPYAAQSAATVVVRFDGPDGTSQEITADDTGFAMAMTPPGSVVTVAQYLDHGNGFVELQVGSYLGVQPGDALVFATPAANPVTIDFTVNVTPPNPGFNVFVVSPCGSDEATAAQGLTPLTFTASPCVDSAFPIIAETHDQNNNPSEFAILEDQLAAENVVYTVPDVWSVLSVLPISATNIPAAMNNAYVTVSTNTASEQLQQAGTLQENIVGTTYTDSLKFIPTDENMTEFSLESTDSSHELDTFVPGTPASIDFDYQSAELPLIDNVALNTATRALTWSEESITGTPASITGRSTFTFYQLSTNPGFTNVAWRVFAPPGATGFAWPQLPSVFSADDIVNMPSGNEVDLSDVSLGDAFSYDDFRQNYASFIGSDSGQPVDAAGGGLVMVMTGEGSN